jgi:Ca2+-binding RTX toxin-like protein
MATLIGGKNDDVLTGGAGADAIFGNGGNDTLTGNGGNDVIDGGAGNDAISGGTGDDTLSGASGNDTITGGDGRDVLMGGAGNDTLSGDAGDDRLEGGAGNDTLNGGTGNDNIQGGDGDDTVVWNAGGGNDDVRGGSGRDTFVVTTSDVAQQTVRITAASGGRLVVTVEGAGGGVTTLQSIEDLKFVVGSGGATIVVGPGVVLPPLNIAGSDGANVIDQSASNQSASIDAGSGDDVVLGGSAVDTIRGGGGHDVIDAGGGADSVDGGTGDDRVVWATGDGSDVVQGGDGVDELDVSLSATGASTLQVGADAAGNVILTNNSGERITADGIEDLVINASAGGSTVTIGSLAGTDVAQSTIHFVGGAGADTFDASAADRRVEAQGNGGDDTLLGGSAGDLLEGGANNDTLRGNGGDDTLRGDSGSDVLDGGAGVDIVDYSLAPAGVFVNLLTGVANDGSGGSDSLVAIENVNGSGFDDTLTGNDAANVLAGLGGNDTLRGNGGADVIGGGDGNDSITGGAGDDTLTGGVGADRYFVVDAGSSIVNVGNDTITDFAPDDVIDVSPVPTISSLAELQATSRQEGADTVIDLGGGNSIRLTGVALGSLTAANFVFAAPPIVGTANSDSLQGTSGNDRILGLGGNDLLDGRAGSDVLDGGDGADIAFYFADANGVIVNLSAAPITAGGVTVQPNSARDGSGGIDTLISIEAVVGSNFGGDTLIGGAAADSLNGLGGADTLSGGGGDDLLSGGAGVDSIDGGAGFDVVLFGSDPAPLGGPLLQIAVNADGSITSFNTSNGETETIVNAEMVVGSLGNDTVVGSGGNDFLGGNFGSDVINGGAGIDTAVYVFNAGTVLTIDLASGTATETFTPLPPPGGPPPPTFNATDTLIGIENVRGSASNETIIGNSGNNVLEGYLGNDLLRGGAGNDTLNGGATFPPTQPGVVFPVEIDGTDTVDYSTDPNAVTVNLLTGVATDGFGGTDTLLSIENANGSGFNDTITGNDAANVLAGLAGNDTLIGNGGADVINGGDGNDSITGGAGNDTLTGGVGGDRYFIVDPGQTTVNIGNDTITDFVAGDTIDLTPVATITSLAQVLAISRQEGADSVIDFGGGNSIRLTGVALGSLTAANFLFASPPLLVVGTPNADFLTGASNNDTILGLGGNDSLTGLAGSDVLDGGDGLDTASYLNDAGSIIANLSAAPITVGGVTVQPSTVRDSFGSTDTLISIEAVLGTNQADTLVGGAGSDTLSGSGGADTINAGDGNDLVLGGAGIDSLDGGTGFDVVLFSGDPASIGAPLLQITLNPGGSITSVNANTGETETNIVNFELVFGSLGNDTINGTAGNDFLGGGFGSDLINGGAGVDTAVYTFNPGTVSTIDLTLGTSSETLTVTVGPPGTPPLTFTAGDTLIGIENVRGSASNETIIGNAGNNVLEGGAGNDLLRGGAGNDTLNGGSSVLLTHPEAVIPVELDGTDTADYSTDGPNGVTVNLLTGVATDGAGGTDTLLSIENANGSSFNDTITGNDAANVLSGLGGNDTLRGNAGADTIDGGDGNDSITGGAGDDTLRGGAGGDRYFVVDPGQTTVNIGNDTIADFASGDAIDLTPVTSITSLAQVLAISRQEGADTVIDLGGGNSIQLTGVALGSLTTASFVFAGGPQFPPGSIVGTAGNDSLNGTLGADQIFGLGGNDSLLGNAGSDLLDGGDGTDTALYLNEPGPIIANLSATPITVGAITVQPGTVRDGAGSVDTLINIENVALIGPASNLADTLIGSDGANQLSGGGGADTILGRDGLDTISGGAGIDIMDGGAGFDIVLFSGDLISNNAPGLRITVNADGSITSVSATETEANLPNFEMLSGSAGNDIITGNAGNNMLGGGFGSDIIDGGDGIDTVNYQFSPQAAGVALTVDLGAGTSSETLPVLVPPPGVPVPPPGPPVTASDTLINIENVSGSTGIDIIYGNAGDNVLQGFLGDDRLRGGAGNDTLDGNVFTLFTHLENTGPSPLDGSDTADYATDPNAVNVNLATGVASDGFGDTDTLVSIENVTGSAFGDMLSGDGLANVLEGLAGADTLTGGAGDDRLAGGAGIDVVDGGEGFDIVDFSADAIAASAAGLGISFDGTTVTAVNATLAETEVATNVEAVIGSLGDDVVVGGAGDDTFIAGAGDDQFDGGAGSDTARFGTAVVVDLAAGSVQGVSGSLALANVENVTASANADTVRGSAAANVLIGGLGDDVLMGRGGADTLIGGTPGVASTDIDTADYSEDGGSVTVNLALGTAIDGVGANDTLVAIERVTGSQFADTLIGDGGNNVLTGLGGNDMLTGGAGVDTFVTTADTGGNAAFGNDVVTDFNVAQDIINLRALDSTFRSFADVQARLTQDGADGVLTVSVGNSVRLQNVNVATLTASNFVLLNLNIIGTDAAETLTGDIGDDNIQGRGGNDTLLGLAGNDTLDGGAGTDILNGGPGNDTLTDPDATGTTMIGGAGNDSITGGTPDYATDPAAIIANLSTAPFDVNGNGSLIVAPRTVRDGYGGTDTLAGTIPTTFSTFEASYFNDTVVGGANPETFFLFAGNDRALGMDGNDTFFGGSGDDFIDGGAGTFDALNYIDIAEDGGTAVPNQGVRLNLSNVAVDIGGGVLLAANSATDQYGHHDSVFNIESVNGSRFGDVIVGSATTSQLSGNDGNDTLLGGSGNESLSGGQGNDIVDGGAGFDSVTYSGTTGSVVNLVTQTATDGLGGTDVIRNVESIFGSQFADDFTGDDSNNNLFGNAGNDTLRGGGGADSLDGGDGNDILQGGDGADQLSGGRNNDELTGGAGQDSFSFSRSTLPPVTDFGVDVITDFSVADDLLNVSNVPELTSLDAVLARATANAQGVLIQINPANSIQLNGVTLADLPSVRFFFSPIVGTAGDDVLDGTSIGESINGFDGNDVINGRGGADFLNGGNGNDTLNGGDDADQLLGTAGNDLLNGEAGSDFMDGGSGDDTLTGGAGNDSFRSSISSFPLGTHGRDVFVDFSVTDDRLDLGGIASMTSRDALNAAAAQVGPDVVITIDATSSITLRNLTLAQLANANVTFAPFVGTAGNDVLNGSSGADNIQGLGGDDTIAGNDGNDNLFGGDGNDDLTGGEGNDTLSGELGNDILRGGAGSDFLHAGAGNDTLSGGAENDYFNIRDGGQDVVTDFGGFDSLDLTWFSSLTSRAALAAASAQVGPDVVITVGGNSVTLQNFTLAQLAAANVILAPLTGTPGNDVLNGTDDRDVIDGLGGDDIITGLAGGDSLSGGDGNDTLDGGTDGDVLTGGNGNDTLLGQAGFDNVDGGPGNDTLTGGSEGDFFLMQSGRDTITDFAAEDILSLNSIPAMTSRAALMAAAQQVGADVVITTGPNDVITIANFTLAQLTTSQVQFAPLIGTEGNDVLNGSDESDFIDGRGGDDVLNGGAGSDQLFGRDGNDTLNGGSGSDQLIPGRGNDTIDGGDSSDFLDLGFDATVGAVVDLAAGTVTDGTGGVDAISNVENVYGTTAGDTIAGDAGGNQLHGFLGNDVLSGRGGADNVHGYDGDDTLNGGTGSDYITGGNGDDLFIFAAGDGVDTIGDFMAGAGSDDVIDLQALPGFDSFADVLAVTADDPFGNAVIDLGGGNQITLAGVAESALHANDFLL